MLVQGSGYIYAGFGSAGAFILAGFVFFQPELLYQGRRLHLHGCDIASKENR